MKNSDQYVQMKQTPDPGSKDSPPQDPEALFIRSLRTGSARVVLADIVQRGNNRHTWE